MDEPGYDNLAMLRDTFGEETMAELFSKERLEVDGVEFVSDYTDSTAERFSIVKPMHLIDRVCVTRGGADLDPATFSMADVYSDTFGLLG